MSISLLLGSHCYSVGLAGDGHRLCIWKVRTQKLGVSWKNDRSAGSISHVSSVLCGNQSLGPSGREEAGLPRDYPEISCSTIPQPLPFRSDFLRVLCVTSSYIKKNHLCVLSAPFPCLWGKPMSRVSASIDGA